MARINFLLQKDFIKIQKKYPNLKLSKFGKNNRIEGLIPLFDDNEVYWGDFQIEIIIDESYPLTFPMVTETGGRIPKEADRHIYSNGSCCLTVKPIQNIEANQGIDLKRYFDVYLVPYLFNQIFFEGHDRFANEEYLHNTRGILQYFIELLKVRNIETCLFLMINFVRNESDLCICGSNLNWLDCHKDEVNTLRSIGKDTVQKYILEILFLLRS